MVRVSLPGTDLIVSRLALGTASLHHLPTRGQRQRLLAAALDRGITHFDTAPSYGFGLAERELGRALRSRRDRVTIATKVGLYTEGSATGTASVWLRKGLGRLVPRSTRPVVDWSVARAAASLRASLERLQTDHIDVLFLHDPRGDGLRVDEVLTWLEDERTRGAIRTWGLSGEAADLSPWLRHPLATVVQARDSLARHEADAIVRSGRPLQLTFGYLSGVERTAGPIDATSVLLAALGRNRTGSILVSTRRPQHLAQMTSAADRERT